MQVEPPQGNILQSSFSEIENLKDERYIANQIEVLSSYKIRDMVADALLDSLNHREDLKYFNFLVDKDENLEIKSISQDYIRKRLIGVVKLSQKKGLDAINITVEGPYFKEAQLISYTYAKVYLDYNLELSREDIQNVKNYLRSEKENKLKELNIAESTLEDFQKRTGIIKLDEQTANLVNTISDYDVEKNATEIEIRANQQKMNILSSEYEKIDPDFNNYIDSKLNQTYLDEIQKEIAGIEVDRDIKLATTTDQRVRQKIEDDASSKINSLQKQLDSQIEIFKKGILSDTPEEEKSLYSNLVEAKIGSRVLSSRAWVPERNPKLL